MIGHRGIIDIDSTLTSHAITTTAITTATGYDFSSASDVSLTSNSSIYFAMYLFI